MPAVSFSLTEKFVIDPILTLRAPPEPGQATGWAATLGQGLQSEVIARVRAVTTPIFAVADAAVHVSTGLYKGADLLVRNVCLLSPSIYCKSIVYEHFRQAAWFCGLAVAGTIAGVVWPGVFKRCRYSPPAPSDDVSGAPAHIQELAKAVLKFEEAHKNSISKDAWQVNELKQLWEKSSLNEKHLIVQVFNRDGTLSFKEIRTELASTVYKPIACLRDRQIQWLSSGEIDQRTTYSWENPSVYKHSFFYHATSQHSLEAILKSGRVEVRYGGAFYGAFVSTRPETGFGRCILAFRRNIERLSSLEHGFQAGAAYWAGFSHDIPVTASTLAYIILDEGTDSECQNLKTHCQQWAGRSIEVISLRKATDHLESIRALNTGIPAEWPSQDDKDTGIGLKILTTLQARAASEPPPAGASAAGVLIRACQKVCARIIHFLSGKRTAAAQNVVQQKAAVAPRNETELYHLSKLTFNL